MVCWFLASTNCDLVSTFSVFTILETGTLVGPWSDPKTGFSGTKSLESDLWESQKCFLGGYSWLVKFKEKRIKKCQKVTNLKMANFPFPVWLLSVHFIMYNLYILPVTEPICYFPKTWWKLFSFQWMIAHQVQAILGEACTAKVLYDLGYCKNIGFRCFKRYRDIRIPFGKAPTFMFIYLHSSQKEIQLFMLRFFWRRV